MVLSVMKMERLSGITLLEADGANQSEEGAKMNNEFLPAYKVYQQVIDLELYYAFVDLVVHTSQEEKPGRSIEILWTRKSGNKRQKDRIILKPITSVTPARSWNGLKRSWERCPHYSCVGAGTGENPCASVRQYVCWKSARQFSPDDPADFQWRCVPARGSLSVGNRYAPPTRPAG